jgi:hypothetical protein
MKVVDESFKPSLREEIKEAQAERVIIESKTPVYLPRHDDPSKTEV